MPRLQRLLQGSRPRSCRGRQSNRPPPSIDGLGCIQGSSASPQTRARCSRCAFNVGASRVYVDSVSDLEFAGAPAGLRSTRRRCPASHGSGKAVRMLGPGRFPAHADRAHQYFRSRDATPARLPEPAAPRPWRDSGGSSSSRARSPTGSCRAWLLTVCSRCAYDARSRAFRSTRPQSSACSPAWSHRPCRRVPTTWSRSRLSQHCRADGRGGPRRRDRAGAVPRHPDRQCLTHGRQSRDTSVCR